MKVLASGAEEMDMQTLERAEQGMLESSLSQGATREFSGNFDTPPGQKVPRGFKERFDEYTHLQQKGQQYDQQHNQPGGNGYQHQLSQLDRMPDIYRKVWHAKSVAGMEHAMGMVGNKEDEMLVAKAQSDLEALKKKYNGTGYYVKVNHQRREFHTYTQAEKDNINQQFAQAEAKLAEAQKQFAERNPEVAKERAFFEQAVAPGYDQSRADFEKAKTEQEKLEALLSQGGNYVTPKGARGRTTKVLVPFTETQKEELTAKVEAGREKLSELEAVFHEKHEQATGYMISRLASKEAAAEYTRVNNMSPEEREAYFNKNRQFIADAKLEKRGDLAWVGISTSQQEMLARAIQFAAEVVSAQAAEETKRNTEALARSTQNTQSLRQQVASLEASGMQIPDAPILGPDGQPLKDAAGNVVSMEQMQTSMLQKLQKDTQELEQLRETAEKFGTKELQARVQIKEAEVSAEQLQLATLHEQNLAFKVAAVKSKTEKSQDTEVTSTVADPKVAPQPSLDDSKAPKHLQAALVQYRSGYTPKDTVVTKGPGTVPMAPSRQASQQMI
jgi:hypothetical protein